MLSRTKIVLVEDEWIIAAAIKSELQMSGYEVIGPATSAEQALRTIERSRPDLVLMDIRINGPVDGIETANQIPKSFQIPVIFMTAHGDKSSRDRARAAGAAAYLIKPVARTTLLSAIETAVDKSSGR
jgi:DNA-binding NarL/FixJ family response regulator